MKCLLDGPVHCGTVSFYEQEISQLSCEEAIARQKERSKQREEDDMARFLEHGFRQHWEHRNSDVARCANLRTAVTLNRLATIFSKRFGISFGISAKFIFCFSFPISAIIFCKDVWTCHGL